MLIVNNRIRIPLAEMEFTFARSSGPGGQNVNKVNSKATLRWPVLASPSLVEPVRSRFLAKFGSRITNEGDLLVVSQRYRDAPRNQQDCLDKLREMIAEVATAPKPRRATKPTRGSQERRLQAKREQTARKQGRKQPRGED